MKVGHWAIPSIKMYVIEWIYGMMQGHDMLGDHANVIRIQYGHSIDYTSTILQISLHKRILDSR